MTKPATGSWPTNPTTSARSRGGGARCPGRRRGPGRASVPPVKCGTSPLMQRSSVDLPEPVGPTTRTSSPSGTVRSTSRSRRSRLVAVVADADVARTRSCGAPSAGGGLSWGRPRAACGRPAGGGTGVRTPARPAQAIARTAGSGTAGTATGTCTGVMPGQACWVATTRTAAGSSPVRDHQPLGQRPRVAAGSGSASRAGRRVTSAEPGAAASADEQQRQAEQWRRGPSSRP